MTVKITGCVVCQGSYTLRDGATVSDGIAAAGGFAETPYGPSGDITVRSRRVRDARYYCRRRIHRDKTDPATVTLRDGDFVVAQYEIGSQPASAPDRQGPRTSRAPLVGR